ncbi:MAG: CheR family methyltransferase [Bacteroidota bacterium]
MRLLSAPSEGSAYRPAPYQKIQIFATDISEPAIAKARTGIYSKSDIKGLSSQQLQDFFTKTNGSYQANKSIRDMCVFAVHNFLKDPPFSKIDFISCRNVLIYMEPYLQKKALTTFHYALIPKHFYCWENRKQPPGCRSCLLRLIKKIKYLAGKMYPEVLFMPAASAGKKVLLI